MLWGDALMMGDLATPADLEPFGGVAEQAAGLYAVRFPQAFINGGALALWGTPSQELGALSPMSWGNGADLGDNYSVMWTGYVYVSASASFTLDASAHDDAVSAWIGRAQMVPASFHQANWFFHNSNNWNGGVWPAVKTTIPLQAGYTPIRIAYCDTGAGDNMQLVVSMAFDGGSGTWAFYHNASAKGF